MNKVDKIRKINNKIVSKNKIDSFERQLINLMNGLYDMNYPMIISNNTKCLNYIDEIDERDGSPIIAICRYDAKRGGFDLNQITSIYGKENIGVQGVQTR